MRNLYVIVNCESDCISGQDGSRNLALLAGRRGLRVGVVLVEGRGPGATDVRGLRDALQRAGPRRRRARRLLLHAAPVAGARAHCRPLLWAQ